MSWIKHSFQAGILILLLISFIIPVYAIDQVSCGKKEISGGIGGSGNGGSNAVCEITPIPKIKLSANDVVWGSHWAIGRLNKEFTTSSAAIYRIFIYGEAFGYLSLSTPPVVTIE